MKKLNILLLIYIFSITGCGRSVKRLTKDSDVYDLSGDWSHQDYKQASKDLSHKISHSGWVDRFKAKRRKAGKNPEQSEPRVLVGDLITKVTTSLINPEDLSTNLEIALNDAGIDVVSGGSFRNQIRKERRSQQLHASESSKAKEAQELGANIMITGMITEADDFEQAGFLRKRREFRIFKVILKIIDVETGLQLYTAITEIKKSIKG
ncbi:MAG: hypothetical protein GY830_00245 [Bacteroidetes bacterium]|nr:hypothetical protein [Bacteroidota bacterium]